MKYIKFPESSHKTMSSNIKKYAWLLFPPFPGLQKNEDIAQTICEETQIDAFVFNYTGLS